MSLALYLIDQKALPFFMQAEFLFSFCFCIFLIEDPNLCKEEKIKPIHIFKKYIYIKGVIHPFSLQLKSNLGIFFDDKKYRYFMLLTLENIG